MGRFSILSFEDVALNPLSGLCAQVSDPALGDAPSNLSICQALSATAKASRDRVNRFHQKQKRRGMLDRQEVSGLISDFGGPNQGCRKGKRASVVVL